MSRKVLECGIKFPHAKVGSIAEFESMMLDRQRMKGTITSIEQGEIKGNVLYRMNVTECPPGLSPGRYSRFEVDIIGVDVN